MAFNPLLAKEDGKKDKLFPYPLRGEIFLLHRGGIQFRATIDSRIYDGNGKIFLSNRRIVFVKKGKPEKHAGFSSAEIPLFLATDVKFEQPILFANYLVGFVKPLAGENAFPSIAKWTITFKKGSCSTFLKVFFPLYEKVSKNQTLYGIYATGFDSNTCSAFVDADDPSKVYFVQPRVNTHSKDHKHSHSKEHKHSSVGMQLPSAPPISQSLYPNSSERGDPRNGPWSRGSQPLDFSSGSTPAYSHAPSIVNPSVNIFPPYALQPPNIPSHHYSTNAQNHASFSSSPHTSSYPSTSPAPPYTPNPQGSTYPGSQPPPYTPNSQGSAYPGSQPPPYTANPQGSAYPGSQPPPYTANPQGSAYPGSQPPPYNPNHEESAYPSGPHAPYNPSPQGSAYLFGSHATSYNPNAPPYTHSHAYAHPPHLHHPPYDNFHGPYPPTPSNYQSGAYNYDRPH